MTLPSWILLLHSKAVIEDMDTLPCRIMELFEVVNGIVPGRTNLEQLVLETRIMDQSIQFMCELTGRRYR